MGAKVTLTTAFEGARVDFRMPDRGVTSTSAGSFDAVRWPRSGSNDGALMRLCKALFGWFQLDATGMLAPE